MNLFKELGEIKNCEFDIQIKKDTLPCVDPPSIAKI